MYIFDYVNKSKNSDATQLHVVNKKYTNKHSRNNVNKLTCTSVLLWPWNIILIERKPVYTEL